MSLQGNGANWWQYIGLPDEQLVMVGIREIVAAGSSVHWLKEGWWMEGGGIYRHVWLTQTSSDAYIAPWGTHRRPEAVRLP